MKRFPFVPTLLLLAVIVYLSLTERPVGHSVRLFAGADKIVHGCMYLALVGVGCFDLYRLSGKIVWSRWVFLTASAIALGGIMELLQGRITHVRSADVFDFVANSGGAVVGLLLAWAVVPKFFRWLLAEVSPFRR